MAKNVELTPKQRRMISALLTSRTLGAACESVGVSRQTLTRWLALPEFNRALGEEEALTMRDTARVLMAGKDRAIDTLYRLMADTEVTPNVRRQSAVDWLTFMHKSYELQTLEERIVALEGRIK